MAKRVILKRAWRTPLGRFDRAMDGVPVDIPERVIRRYPLPSDAEIVSKDYIPPLDREDVSDGDMDRDGSMTEAEMQREIQQRVDAALALKEAEARGLKSEGVAKKANELLDKEEKASTPMPCPEGVPESCWDAENGCVDPDALVAYMVQTGSMLEKGNDAGTDKGAGDATSDEEEDTEEDEDAHKVDLSILSRPTTEVMGLLDEMSFEGLEALLEVEKADKKRKGLIIHIEAAMADFE